MESIVINMKLKIILNFTKQSLIFKINLLNLKSGEFLKLYFMYNFYLFKKIINLRLFY